MNLYLISAYMQGVDTYESAVVASESYGKAKLIHPDGRGLITKDSGMKEWMRTWPDSVQQINCTCIGTTNYYKEGDVICASYNAG